MLLHLAGYADTSRVLGVKLIFPAVKVTAESGELFASGSSPGDADREHATVKPGVGELDHLCGGHELPQSLGDVRLQLVMEPEIGAMGKLATNRIEDDRMGMAEELSRGRLEVVDISISIDVDQVGTLAVGHGDRVRVVVPRSLDEPARNRSLSTFIGGPGTWRATHVLADNARPDCRCHDRNTHFLEPMPPPA